jgi:hypothetical protein
VTLDHRDGRPHDAATSKTVTPAAGALEANVERRS